MKHDIQHIKTSAQFEIPIVVETLEQHLFVNMFVALQSVKRLVDQECSQHGVSGPQYNVLRCLQAHGGKASMMEIIKGMFQVQPGLTRLVQRLLKAGYVKRKRDNDDQRVVIVSITEEGEDFVQKLSKKIDARLIDYFSNMTPLEMKSLISLLKKTLQNTI